MPYSYSLDFKKAVIQRLVKGESIKSLSQELRVSQSTIYQWRKAFREIQIEEEYYTAKKLEKMVETLHRLEHEKEILQLSGCLNKIPLQEKLAILE